MNAAPTRALLALLTLTAACAAGCDEDPGEQPVLEPLPTVPALSLDAEGHLSRAQRGVALDPQDLSVIAPGSDQVGVSPSALTSSFGLLVLNRPYVDSRSVRCPPSDEAAAVQPRAVVEDQLERFADEGMTFDRVAVNVPLMTPGRRGLLYVCFDEGARDVRFDVLEHRREVVDAFRDLAASGEVQWITVGLEMNRYYHLLSEDGQRQVDDYSNWVTLYHAIYDAIKEVDADIRVGPGLSWAVFHRRTMPEMADTLGFADPTGLEAAVAAYNRTVRPLLSSGRGADRRLTADYLGLTMIPFDNEDPWNGEAASEEEGRQAELYQAFRWLPLVLGVGTADELPLVLPMIDWAENSGAAGVKKGAFMETLKTATGGLEVEWAAWRRLSTLPDEPPQANPCRIYTASSEAALRYDITYCNSGMLSESGQRRTVWDIFLTDP